MAKPKNKDMKNAKETPVEGVSDAKAIVLEDFAFQIRLSPKMPGYTQVFKRKTIVTNPMLIRQMLEAKKPIETIE